MPNTAPNLGYGQRGEVPIDAYNQWQRSQPWYQTLIKSFGQDPSHVHLNDDQKQQVIRAAQANGVVVDEGHNGQEVDDSGNFHAKSHTLRNTLMVAGIAGAALLTAGAAGVFGGAAAGAGEGAAAGGGLAASTTVPTVGGLAAGGTGLAAGAGAGVGGAAAGGASTLGGLAGIGRFLTTPGGAQLASTAGGIFANIYGANKQASANEEAARLADEATKRAEQFSREQAESGWQSSEHTQHSNYDQWRATQDAIMGSLGHALGINYTAPEYAPGIDPRYTGGAPSAGGSTAAGDPAAAFIRDWQATHPVSEGKEPLLAALKAKGFDAAPYLYGQTPSGNEISLNGQKYKVGVDDGKGGLASWYQAGTNDGGGTASRAPTLATFVAPNFLPTPTPYRPYQPGTLGAYVGGV